jgi:hypothetical protein
MFIYKQPFFSYVFFYSSCFFLYFILQPHPLEMGFFFSTNFSMVKNTTNFLFCCENFLWILFFIIYRAVWKFHGFFWGYVWKLNLMKYFYVSIYFTMYG